MNKTVVKFGGSSVATIEKIQAIAEYLQERVEQGEQLCVVVSAMGKTTNDLLAQAYALNETPNTRELDRLLSTGEQQTIALLTMALHGLAVRACSLTGEQAGISTIGIHTRSKIKTIDAMKIEQYFGEHQVVIVAGFQGVNEQHDITTLGRGGSDTTAVALAAALGCDCEIYTDVAGIYTTDPRVYAAAKQIESISYDEMMEMSALGASVMETRSVELGKKYGVRIYVAAALSKQRGTYIMGENEIMEQKVISAVSSNRDILSVSIEHIPFNPQIISDIFKTCSAHYVNVDMISQTIQGSHVAVSFTCNEDEERFLLEAQKLLQARYPMLQFTLHKQYAKLSVVGIGMRDAVGVASRVFEVFASHNIMFYQITTSEISMSYTIDKAQVSGAIRELCLAFDL